MFKNKTIKHRSKSTKQKFYRYFDDEYEIRLFNFLQKYTSVDH